MFREEFEVPGVVPASKWTHHLWYSNDTEFWYDFNLPNWKVENGELKIWTPKRSDGFWQYDNRLFTTDGLFTARYGIFEAEIQLTPGAGLWPSFWLYAHNDGTRPEIDIMEAYQNWQAQGDWFGPGYTPIDYSGTIHNGPDGSTHRIGQQRLSDQLGRRDLSLAFHTYACIWEQGGVTFLFDGIPIGQKIFTDELVQQMFMLIGTGTGLGPRVKYRRADGPYPQDSFNSSIDGVTPETEANSMRIRHVRAWRLGSGHVGTTATGGNNPNPSV